MKSTPKRSAPGREIAGAVKLRLRRAYRVFRFSQSGGTAIRRCVACGCRVTNRNLRGYNERSALSGDLWCYSCADNAPPIFRAIVRLA